MRWAGLGAAVLFACGGTVSHTSGGTGSTGPASDAGYPDGGASDAGPVDAGPADAGYTGADCNGIVPTAMGTAYTFDVSSSGSCSAATSDGTGIIAAEASQQQWAEYDGRGVRTGAFQSTGLLPQPLGFIGTVPGSLVHWDEYGGTMNSAPIDSGALIAPRWSGGALVLAAGSAGLTVRRFDASAVEAESATLAGSFTLRGGAEDANGAVLALTGASAVSGIWFDLAKGAAGPTFPIGSATSVAARALVGGGIAVRLDGHWSAMLLPGDGKLHLPPAWLSDGSDFTVVRGGKAYARTASGSAVDLVSAQGNLCGSMSFSGMNGVSIGADGTVIGASGPQGCTKVFWRALLQ